MSEKRMLLVDASAAKDACAHAPWRPIEYGLAIVRALTPQADGGEAVEVPEKYRRAILLGAADMISTSKMEEIADIQAENASLRAQLSEAVEGNRRLRAALRGLVGAAELVKLGAACVQDETNIAIFKRALAAAQALGIAKEG